MAIGGEKEIQGIQMGKEVKRPLFATDTENPKDAITKLREFIKKFSKGSSRHGAVVKESD